MATTNGSTAIRDKILASLARYRALRIGKFPCAFWRLSARPGLTAKENNSSQKHLYVYDKAVTDFVWWDRQKRRANYMISMLKEK
ncbi:hypothetical protein [Bathymodiolus japonicus methanotrophic gill symbiont]|uniref:hypothetical protein n=1 Tax=Bathymodiolus japonicus methanotrophic gill symbiont TaxID=113269 RepID=UPI001C8EC0DB|nr:hypothetical protein [Bathymodiolus japonicus methanotrophic gill symbiont]